MSTTVQIPRIGRFLPGIYQGWGIYAQRAADAYYLSLVSPNGGWYEDVYVMQIRDNMLVYFAGPNDDTQFKADWDAYWNEIPAVDPKEVLAQLWKDYTVFASKITGCEL